MRVNGSEVTAIDNKEAFWVTSQDVDGKWSKYGLISFLLVFGHVWGHRFHFVYYQTQVP